MIPPEYPYTRRDLLAEPERYSYAPHRGPEFLESHRRARADLVASLGEASAQPVPRPATRPNSRPGDGGFATRDVLLWLVADRREGAADDDRDEAWTLALARRYEITKRLYCAYSDRLRPASDRFDQIESYAALAELTLDHPRAAVDLRRLNVGLKLLDLLGSVAPPAEPWSAEMVRRAVRAEGLALQRLSPVAEMAA